MPGVRTIDPLLRRALRRASQCIDMLVEAEKNQQVPPVKPTAKIEALRREQGEYLDFLGRIELVGGPVVRKGRRK